MTATKSRRQTPQSSSPVDSTSQILATISLTAQLPNGLATIYL